jgi:uncharacterized protein
MARRNGPILMALALLALLGWHGPAAAEKDNMLSTVVESLRNRPAMTNTMPSSRGEGRRRVPTGPAAPVVIRDTPGRPSVEPSTFITVFGDSLAEMLATGLEEANADDDQVDVSRKTRASSGLVRTDFYDWRQVIRDVLAGPDKLSFAVVMLGSNDRQAMKDVAGAALDPFTDPWRDAYAARVTEIMKAFAEKNVPVIWVGNPIMESQKLSADMLALNEIIRTAVRNAGGTYVDLWEAFADDQNRYSPIGPDMNGDTVKLRAADGVHFTRAGARKAAHFVEVEIKRALDRQPPADTILALPLDPNDPASSDPALQPGGIERLIDQVARSGIDGDPLPNLSLPQKPLAGPIQPLSGFEPTAGAALLGAPPPRGTTEAGRLIEQVLVKGQSPDPKPGRGDDFRWPLVR